MIIEFLINFIVGFFAFLLLLILAYGFIKFFAAFGVKNFDELILLISTLSGLFFIMYFSLFLFFPWLGNLIIGYFY